LSIASTCPPPKLTSRDRVLGVGSSLRGLGAASVPRRLPRASQGSPPASGKLKQWRRRGGRGWRARAFNPWDVAPRAGLCAVRTGRKSGATLPEPVRRCFYSSLCVGIFCPGEKGEMTRFGSFVAFVLACAAALAGLWSYRDVVAPAQTKQLESIIPLVRTAHGGKMDGACASSCMPTIVRQQQRPLTPRLSHNRCRSGSSCPSAPTLLRPSAWRWPRSVTATRPRRSSRRSSSPSSGPSEARASPCNRSLWHTDAIARAVVGRLSI